ncbi:ankyrin repeat-containing domain protein [Trichophaea hybrida]|nr:ankyrin repeat-containing domain protein [Trichophaea hybrida]
MSSILHYAASSYREDLVRHILSYDDTEANIVNWWDDKSVLLNYDISPNTDLSHWAPWESLTPLHSVAVFNGSSMIVRMMVEAGADLNARDDYLGAIPLILSVYLDDDDEVDADLVRTLIECGSDIHAVQKFGLSAAQVAAVLGHHVALNILVEMGADVAPVPADIAELVELHQEMVNDRLREICWWNF